MTNRPKAGTGLPATSASVPIALTRAREQVMTPIRAMLASSGVTEQQWRVLRVLDENGPLDATKLAERSCLLMPSQTRIVQTLVEKGMVTRRPDASDRRRQTVAITDRGRALIAENLPAARKIAARIEQKLGKRDLDTLLDLLRRLEGL